MNTSQGAKGFHQHSSPEQLVDSLNCVFGKQQLGVRAVHAKGINLKGTFRPSNSARSVSRAPHFQNPNIPIDVRFSDFTGFPAIADSDPLASPRGMAIKFHLPDGSDTDIVAHSFNGFPVATADEFRELMIAMASSGPRVTKPTPLDSFLTAHPAAKTFLESQIPPPASYATVSYFGVNAFKFSNEEGQIKSLLDATRFNQRKVNSPCRPRRPRALNPTTSRTKSKLAFITSRSGSSYCFRSLTKTMTSMTPPSHGQTPAFKSNSGYLRSREQYPTMPLPNVSCCSYQEFFLLELSFRIR